MHAPSRSATDPVSRVPSTNVPWLEPASSIRPAAEIRACSRETVGSSSRSVASGPRPIVTSSVSGMRVPPASTSSRGAPASPSGAPQLPQKAAPRVTWRRQSGHSTARALLHGERLEHRVVAPEPELDLLGRVVDRDPQEIARGGLDAVVGLYDDDLLPVGPPDHLAGADLELLGVGEQEVAALGEQQLGPAVRAHVDDRHALPLGGDGGVEHALTGFRR